MRDDGRHSGKDSIDVAESNFEESCAGGEAQALHLAGRSRRRGGHADERDFGT
jgi:hypothetical protein